MIRTRMLLVLALSIIALVAAPAVSHATVDVTGMAPSKSKDGWYQPGETVNLTVAANCPAGKVCGESEYVKDPVHGYIYTFKPVYRGLLQHSVDFKDKYDDEGAQTLRELSAAATTVSFKLLNDKPDRYDSNIQTAGVWHFTTEWYECTPDAAGLVKVIQTQCTFTQSAPHAIKVAPIAKRDTRDGKESHVGRRDKPAGTIEGSVKWMCNGPGDVFYTARVTLEKHVKQGKKKRWVKVHTKPSKKLSWDCLVKSRPTSVSKSLRSTSLRFTFTITAKGPKKPKKLVVRTKPFTYAKLPKPTGGGISIGGRTTSPNA